MRSSITKTVPVKKFLVTASVISTKNVFVGCLKIMEARLFVEIKTHTKIKTLPQPLSWNQEWILKWCRRKYLAQSCPCTNLPTWIKPWLKSNPLTNRSPSITLAPIQNQTQIYLESKTRHLRELLSSMIWLCNICRLMQLLEELARQDMAVFMATRVSSRVAI